MARVKARKQRTQKLFISGERRGEIRFDSAYTALDAARRASKLTKQGYKVKVTARTGHVKMTCEPVNRASRNQIVPYADCVIKPAFKKQIKGLAGAKSPPPPPVYLERKGPPPGVRLPPSKQLRGPRRRRKRVKLIREGD